ncbi:MAG: MaoC family dehydratase [Methylobacteriaceae bacterium]|nr:MaoC family dehydratase [Methylobacteriaceae bacterium]
MLSSAALYKTDKRKIDAADLESFVGQEIGVSDWALIDQDRIDAFAEVTFDPYFIHIDPERAKRETPFGSTIAHGFLTLSMLSVMAYDALPDIVGRTMGLNYGFDKIRFISPVPAASRIRGRFTISDVTRKPGQAVVRYAVSVEIEGKDKPALAAEWLTIAFLG